MSDNVRPYFLLRAEGHIHRDDIRHVSTAGGVLLTSSRDQTTSIIEAPTTSSLESGDSIHTKLVLVGHTSFVNFSIFHSGIALLDGEPCVITGSNDKHVALWNPQTAALEAVMDGHNHGVCCGLVVGPTASETGEECDDSIGDIVTGDWNGVCCVFDAATGRVRERYEGHGKAVRAVAQLPGTPYIVSASGDKTLHQWNVKTAERVAVYNGHGDVVQCVCAIGPTRFASSGNDLNIIIWDTKFGVSPLRILQVHYSLVYSLCYSSERQLLFSASEDGTVKVIRGVNTAATSVANSSSGGDDVVVLQSINHPCVVWTVCTTEAGDIVTGGADGTVRVWTTDDNLMASVEKLEALQEAIAAQKMDVKVTPIAGLDIGDLPSLEDIGQRKGSQEGERLFVRTPEGTVEVYAWDSGRYEKIGLVTDGAPNRPYKGTQSQVSQSRPKVYLDGKPYDYVFDVDVDGKMLKLPYNRNQNVFEAAQSFINENSQFVSQIHKEEIQNFILQNIDPQDVQQLIGSQQQPSAAPTAAGGGAVSEPLFSQFAREAALMRESGASHVPSYTEALRNLESAGVTASDVAFSAYAREEIELQKSQKASQEPAVEKSDVVAWTKHALLTAFNTEGAQKKVIELTGDATSGEVVRRVERAVTGDPSVEVLAEAIRLYTQLPESSRFPALDLLRYLLAVVPRPYEWLMLLLNAEVNVGDTSPLEFMKECVVGIGRMHDLEKLVAVRLFHHVAAAVDGLPANTTLAVEQVDVLSDMFTTAPNSLIKSNMNGNLKRAISALLQSVSLVLAHGTPSLSGEFRLNCTRECMRMISRLLLLEPISSPLVADLLATVLTLLQTHSVADAAAEVGRSSLLHVVGALRNGSEQRCRGAVDKILRILDTEAS